jgi:uncharacterized protein
MEGTRPLAIVTGASTGIGRALALEGASRGFDLVIAADEPLESAASAIRTLGADVTSVLADLATRDGVDRLYDAVRGRHVAVLCANAGHGLGKGFLDQEFTEVQHVIDTNITGTIDLIQRVARDMRGRGEGRILITGSIAGFMPGTFQAVYNGSKAFLDSFSYALRNELEGTGVTVTCLMPSAVILRCASASSVFGMMLASATRSLFESPATTPASPFIIASQPTFATSAGSAL